jgi:hypothetical protein
MSLENASSMRTTICAVSFELAVEGATKVMIDINTVAATTLQRIQ